MKNKRVSATFQDRSDAERAHSWLRKHGINDDHVAILASDENAHASVGAGQQDKAADARDVGSDAAKGAVAGAGVGALFGLAALAIPGIGPFIAAGWLATALGATAGAIVSGAVVGGTAGTLAGALADSGYDKNEADCYAKDVVGGATLVTVNIPRDSSIDADEIYDAFRGFNGRIFAE